MLSLRRKYFAEFASAPAAPTLTADYKDDSHINKPLMDLKQRIINSIYALYLGQDNKVPESGLEKAFDFTAEGRARAIMYISALNAPEINSVPALLDKVAKDLQNFEGKSALSSSIDMRDRIRAELLAYLGITQEQIDAETKRRIVPMSGAAIRETGGVAGVNFAEKRAKDYLIEQAAQKQQQLVQLPVTANRTKSV